MQDETHCGQWVLDRKRVLLIRETSVAYTSVREQWCLFLTLLLGHFPETIRLLRALDLCGSSACIWWGFYRATHLFTHSFTT